MNAAQKAKHAARVTAANQQYRSSEKFLVIETATNMPVGNRKPMVRPFAEYVLNVRDIFSRGDFFLQSV